MTFSINESKEYRVDGDIFLIILNEKVSSNESIGDRIGIEKDTNILWFSYDLKFTKEIFDFIDNYFTSPSSTILNIYKILH